MSILPKRNPPLQAITRKARSPHQGAATSKEMSDKRMARQNREKV